jgi:predicted AAA+ superfamily ATPase
MPGSLPIYAPRVRDELTRYLNDQWNAVIDSDVDGAASEPRAIEAENTRYGQLQAARRVARTIFLGSVPTKAAKGTEDVRIKLGVVQPDENISVFGDALSRLRERLSHLYQTDQGRYWFDVQPNLTRTVADRANKVEDWQLWDELKKRLDQVKETGLFERLHRCPTDGGDVADESEARLVVVHPQFSHRRGAAQSRALEKAQAILDSRGNSPRRFRNMLLFVSTDEDALGRLQEETRRYLAWRSIVEDGDALNLDRTQRQQAERARDEGDKTISLLLDGSYTWLLVPTQEGTNPIVWETISLSGADFDSVGNFVQRASNKARSTEALIPAWSPVHLKRELDNYLWKDGRAHIKVKEVWEALATYAYFPRLKNHTVLMDSVKDGLRTKDFFGYALSAADDGSYRGLVFGESTPSVYFDNSAVIVKPEVAAAAAEKDRPVSAHGAGGDHPTGGRHPGEPDIDVPAPPPAPSNPKRFFGRIQLDPQRLSRGAGQINEEVLQHLAGLVGSNVEVELEITVSVPEGIPDRVVRTVTENARTLKFDDFGFEEE